MKIEKLSVENFKGLESLEFKPKGVNLITGRNNTGKTSLLEAVNLLFNPKGIKNYGSNYVHLIRENYDSCEISAGLKNSSTTLRLEELDQQKVWEDYIIYFKDRYANSVTRNLKRGIKRIKNTEESELELEELKETLYEGLEEQLDNISPNNVLSEPIMVIKDGKEYPFVKSNVSKFIDSQSLFKRLITEIEKRDEIEKEIMEFLSTYPYRVPSRGFIRDVPEGSESIGLIEDLDPRKLAEDEDDEKVAVKEDDIEEYIKEKELLDNLKSFSLNQLVFKKNGKKYGVPFEFMGDGFKTIVGILWHLMEGEYEEDIVLIEEPENHMHPGYTRELVYFLTDISQKHDTQFFITTHNRDFIEGFFGKNLTENEKDYLEKEFLILNLSKHGFNAYDYEKSKSQKDDLMMDLRGI